MTNPTNEKKEEIKQENQTETKSKTETTENLDEGKSPIEEAKEVLELMKKERERIEKATSEMLISGRSYAGQPQFKEETADEKWAREAKERYAGTGMDPTI